MNPKSTIDHTARPDGTVHSMLDDLAAALGDESVIGIVDAFKDVSLNQMKLMEEATARNDAAKLRQEAHSLKSSSANLGAQTLSEICLQLEKAEAVTSEVSELLQKAKLCQTLAVESMLNWRNVRNS